ncbi:proteinaceous RNase P 2 isoform X1 [Typha latifolia]|uniref:proteinaceous RNase P 2 isoform X1 n=1 Tax=Typha latifolia TaxID=4733 RepID=UPI003C3083FA
MELATHPNSTKKTKKTASSKESQFRHALDTCSKSRDLSGALALYHSAVSGELAGGTIHLSAYHFNSLLHLCSSSIETLDESSLQRSAAVDSGFAIFDRMVASGIAPTEATITSMARIASHKMDGGGDLAFDLVKTMGEKYGLAPRLRTYSPALFSFCKNLEAEKAYSVVDHMISMGVTPEEPEIAALFNASTKVGREDKVYEYLQRLRSSVGAVGSSTAEILECWFRSEQAAEVGSSNWDVDRVKDAILMNGGGWHGVGWLGIGRWEVRRANVSSEGRCSGCGQRLACVDIDVVETEKFAESVASLAMERETKSNFSNFQEWLEMHSEYEAIIDGANVGLYQQNFASGGFSLSQLDAVVRELRKGCKSKWPLIILHNKRVAALMEVPSNRQLLETWRGEGALYTTPTGSNDDWYWLYAAIKLKCLLVTNDEMRDHIFELLGRSFFPKWKERHQVKYTFNKGNLMLLMPPPYTLAIQESETGSWHVPVDDKSNEEKLRTWLCITRLGSSEGLGEAHESLVPLEPNDKKCPSNNNNCTSTISASLPWCSNETLSESSGEKEAGSVIGKRKYRS